MSHENNVEFLKGQTRATFDFSQGRYISKMKKLAKNYPDDCDYIENPDGSIFGHMPVKWLKISPPRKVTEAQRQAASERIKQYHKSKKK